MDKWVRTIEVLSESFPKAFFVNPRQRIPPKKNILADINRSLPSELEGANIGAAVDYYCTHYGYLKALCMAGTKRVNLEGVPVDTVTESEARAAVLKINAINQRKNEMNDISELALPNRSRL